MDRTDLTPIIEEKDRVVRDLAAVTRRPNRLVYIAGPYSKGDQVLNVRRAVEAAEEVAERCDSWVPIVPHLSMLWHAMSPHDVYYWYGYGLLLVECCQAVLRLPGESRGTEMEFARAVERGIPIVDSVNELLRLR
jgi:hypothetical protein